MVIQEELVDKKKAKSALVFQPDYFANDSCYEEDDDVEVSIRVVTNVEVQCAENAENIQPILVPLSIYQPIRKRGRPKGSKNKPRT